MTAFGSIKEKNEKNHEQNLVDFCRGAVRLELAFRHHQQLDGVLLYGRKRRVFLVHHYKSAVSRLNAVRHHHGGGARVRRRYRSVDRGMVGRKQFQRRQAHPVHESRRGAVRGDHGRGICAAADFEHGAERRDFIHHVDFVLSVHDGVLHAV